MSNSPARAPLFDVTDEQLSAELKKWTGSTPALHPVGELLDRHWEAAFAYARMCTDGPRAAGMLTTATFTRIFGETIRQAGPTSGWRPELLVTVRRIAAEWETDGRLELLHPDLRAGGERASARLLPTAERRLLSRAFQRLPQSARALLWHTEVEADPLTVPAALVGLDVLGAEVELERAHGRLREECLQVHRELAPEDECLRYIRMLDVTYRRGGVDVDPDLQEHLGRCTHCRHTADQLAQFAPGLLGTALAEAVLGWGGRAYHEARLSGAADGPAAGAETAVPSAETVLAGGEPFDDTAPPAAGPGSRRVAQRAARRARRRNLAAAVATVSALVVLPLALWSVLSSQDSSSAAAGSAASGTAGRPSASASAAGAGVTSKGALRGRLHNVSSGLCIAVTGGKAVRDAETQLAKCTGSATQQWSYESDGQLRNGADPGLCLDSHLAYTVRLEPCTDTTDRNLRYDFTLQGVLVPRWNQNLALTPAATDGGGALVLKNRTDATNQRWVIDTSVPGTQMESVNWDADSSPSATAAPKTVPLKQSSPTASPASRAGSASPSAAQSTPADDPTTDTPCDGYTCGDGHSDHGGGGFGGGGGRGGAR
nr:RICIN domain-containing protein [Streptomyces mangrovisoli]